MEDEATAGDIFDPNIVLRRGVCWTSPKGKIVCPTEAEESQVAAEPKSKTMRGKTLML